MLNNSKLASLLGSKSVYKSRCYSCYGCNGNLLEDVVFADCNAVTNNKIESA